MRWNPYPHLGIVIRISDFGLLSGFGLRISDFRGSALVLPLPSITINVSARSIRDSYAARLAQRKSTSFTRKGS